MVVFSTVDISSVEQEVKSSQEAVERLLDNEEKALARIEEIAVIADDLERFEEAAKLIAECDAFLAFSKEMEGAVKRAKKRMDKVRTTIMADTLEDVEKAGGEVETKNWLLKVRDNPASVVVDSLADVPKKYRSEPMPIPEWPEWPVDKNMVKQALVKEKVQKIDGVHLEQGTRLEIKPR